MRIFGITGHSGMGKTTLLERLIPELRLRGLRVSLIKHSHKAIDVDRPGKDSYRLREAGCNEVIVIGQDRWALIHELRGAPEPSLEDLISRVSDCDILLIEGMKQGDFPKIEVWRAELDRSPLCPGLPGVLAIASDDTVDENVHVLPLRNEGMIADFLLARSDGCASARKSQSVSPRDQENRNEKNCNLPPHASCHLTALPS